MQQQQAAARWKPEWQLGGESHSGKHARCVGEGPAGGFTAPFPGGQPARCNRSQGLTSDLRKGCKKVWQLDFHLKVVSATQPIPSYKYIKVGPGDLQTTHCKVLTTGETQRPPEPSQIMETTQGLPPQTPQGSVCGWLAHGFIQLIFTGRLLCLRQWSRHLRYNRERKNTENSLPLWNGCSNKGREVENNTE